MTKIVSLFSGGLDSVVATYIAIVEACRKSNTVEVHLLYVKYGCHAQNNEIRAGVFWQAEFSRRFPNAVIRYVLEDVSSLSWLRKTPLVGGVVDQTIGAENRKAEWVPARNFLLVSIGCSLADSIGADTVVVGFNAEDASVYSDNSMDFLKSLNDVASLGCYHSDMWVRAPLGYMSKAAILKQAQLANLDTSLMWSCYTGDSTPCGKCGPCVTRLQAKAQLKTEV